MEKRGAGESLRWALRGNAVFSTVSGVMMVLKPELVSSWLGVSIAWLLPWIGGGLLLFAVDLVHQSVQAELSSLRARIASVSDFAWTLGTVVLLVGWGHLFSWQGKVLLVAIAVVVEVFGSWQWLGLRAMLRQHNSVVDAG
jgi:hypothetical protein